MRVRVIAVFGFLVIMAVGAVGQEIPAVVGATPEELERAKPKAQNPVPGEKPDEAGAQLLRRFTPVTQDLNPPSGTGPDAGDIFTTAPAAFPTSGIAMVAKPAYPNISAKLGANTWQSAFTVFDANNTMLWSVYAPGQMTLSKDHDIITGLTAYNASNSNPGSASSASVTGFQFYEAGQLKGWLRRVGSGSSSAAGGANAMQLWNAAVGGLVLGTSGVERMRIQADGSIVMGTTSTPAQGRLWVVSYAPAFPAVMAQSMLTTTTNVSTNTDAILAQITETVTAGMTNSGSSTAVRGLNYLTGPGTIETTIGGFFFSGVGTGGAGGTINQAYGGRFGVGSGIGTVNSGFGVHISDVLATTDYSIYSAGTNDTAYFAGNMGVGTLAPAAGARLHVVGNVVVDGSITGTTVIGAVYQDLAEWVPATSNMTPGTVVVLNPEKSNEVMPSSAEYDHMVAGVVSAQPGIILGVSGDSKEQIATTGRVRVRVDATQGAIRVGDLLVTSGKAGMAMRSEPMDINGRKFHQPGTIIGKALEPLASGEGEILVLLSMQ